MVVRTARLPSFQFLHENVTPTLRKFRARRSNRSRELSFHFDYRDDAESLNLLPVGEISVVKKATALLVFGVVTKATRRPLFDNSFRALVAL